MSQIFYLKKGDTATPLEALLRDAKGSVNLTNTSVVFSMKSQSGVLKIERGECLIADQALDEGQISYLFDPADVDTAGIYAGEFVVTFSNGKTATFPRGGRGRARYITIEVQEDVE